MEAGNGNTRFKPGVSGNPSGRPKGLAEFQERARKKCKAALQLCESYIADTTAAPAIRLEAVKIILDRGLGKVPQTQPLVAYTDEELVSELLERKKIRNADEQRNRVRTPEPTQ